jgi:ankyrin repeat protein
VGDLDMIRRLVINGGDPSVGDYDDRTALHLAASAGQVEVVKFLLDQVRSAMEISLLKLIRHTYTCHSSAIMKI